MLRQNGATLLQRGSIQPPASQSSQAYLWQGTGTVLSLPTRKVTLNLLDSLSKVSHRKWQGSALNPDFRSKAEPLLSPGKVVWEAGLPECNASTPEAEAGGL